MQEIGVNARDRCQQPSRHGMAGHGTGDLDKALTADEVSLEARAERVAAPGHAGRAKSGAPQQRVVEHGVKGRAGGELIGDGAADDGEDLRHR